MVHKNEHIGDKAFECTHCCMTFLGRYALKIHLRIHIVEKTSINLVFQYNVTYKLVRNFTYKCNQSKNEYCMVVRHIGGCTLARDHINASSVAEFSDRQSFKIQVTTHTVKKTYKRQCIDNLLCNITFKIYLLPEEKYFYNEMVL